MISTGKIFLFLTLIFSFYSNSRELNKGVYFGVSQVFKAQVYKLPNLQSDVISHLSKGEKIKVHLKHFKEKLIKDKFDD